MSSLLNHKPIFKYKIPVVITILAGACPKVM
nr:MAG TPA: hypothetical protein [Caudoviricetes sp.]